MSLKHRIGRLEEEVEPERCDNCQDWPDPFVVYEASDKDPLEGMPDHCPKCGYEPFVIIVCYSEEAGRL
jgi:hypothetical protein